MWYAVEYYSAIKNNEIMSSAATWMNLEIVILSKSEKNKYMLSLICGILKKNTNELIYETETDS